MLDTRAVAVASTSTVRPPRRKLGAGTYGALTIVAIALFFVSATVLQGQSVQLVVMIAAVIGASVAGSRWGKEVRGPEFDLSVWVCSLWLILIVGAALLAPILPLAEHQDLSAALAEPAMATPNLVSAHPLGTNNFGLDILARIIYGARVSLVVSLGAVVVGMVIGGAIGILSGYFRGAIDMASGIFTNSLLAIPPLVLLIALATVLPPNLGNLTFGLSLLALPAMVRMARASTMAFAQREFVLAAKSMGATRIRTMVKELLPNVFLPMASYAMVIVSVLIVAEASLSFLGLGVKPPEPSWGNLVAEGEGGVFQRYPHVVLMPGLALFFTVYSLNLLGEKARRRWDPRQAKI